MSGINVGSVLVDVLPDARGWDEKLSAQITPAAEAVGKKISRDLEDDIADGARKGAERAKVDLATIGDTHVNVDVDNTAALAKLAEVDVAAKEAQKSAAASANGMSPLIMAAVAGGLIAGGPLLVAAAGVAAAGVAAVFLHNQQDVAHAASEMAQQVTASYQGVADAAVPDLTLALRKLGNAAVDLAPQMRDMFTAVGPAIQGVTNGVIGLAQGAMPGLVAMIKSSGPVFDGLKNFLTSIGTGLGAMFQTLSEHSSSFGQVFTSLGDVLHAVLPSLGELISAGGELGAAILPPLASTLSAVGDVLHVIAPILPEIAFGFLAIKSAGALAPLLGALAASLETVGASAMVSVAGLTGVEGAGVAAGAGFEVAAAGARGLEGAMGPIGWILAGISLAVPALISAFGRQTTIQKSVQDSAEAMNAALEKSKGVIDDDVRAMAAKQAQEAGLLAMSGKWGVASSTVIDALLGQKDAMAQVQNAARGYVAGQEGANAAAKKGEAVSGDYTRATGDEIRARETNIHKSKDQLTGLEQLSGKVQTSAKDQKDLAKAIDGTSDSASINAARLRGIANAASAGNTQINLLKGALDALSGKAVSLGAAEVAVTQAVDAGKTALDGQKDAAGHLTSKLTDANGALDKHTAAGAAAWTSLTSLAGASNTLIATMEQQGATTDVVAAKDAELRDQFINTAEQMGLSAGAANDLANQIYGIPEQRKTEITVDTAAATQAAKDLADRIAAIQSKTVQVTVHGVYVGDHVAGLNGGPGGTQLANARGNIVHAYASGGIEPNMSAGIAQIVAPQTYRVIGDRVTDDEAYIPINNSMRSLQILAQTANRMNFDLAPTGARPRSSSDGAGSQFTVYAQFGDETIEARAVRVVDGKLGDIADRVLYAGG